MKPKKTSPANFRLTVGITIAIAAATLLAFAPVRQNDFLNWDDQSYVTQNDHVQGGLTKAGIVWAFTSSHSANWHPLTWISHMVDVALFGMKPSGHHVTSLLLHAVNSAVLFLLLRLLTGSVWRSAFVAALFALHPLRVESVAWVAERKDVLSTFFGLLSLMAYGSYAGTAAQKRSTPHPAQSISQCAAPHPASGHLLPKAEKGLSPSEAERASRKSKAAYACAFGFLALGLMSKPMLVTWPFVMLLLDFWPLQRIQTTTPHPTLSPIEAERAKNAWPRLILEKLPFLGLAIVSSIVTVMAQQRGGAVASLEHLPLALRLQNAAIAYVEYLWKFLWPVNLSPIYPHPAHIESWRVIVAVALLASLTAFVWVKRRRWPFLLTGWFWFLGTLVPVIGIVQVGSQAFADRYTYVPMIGIALGLVWFGGTFIEKLHVPKPIIAAASVAILGVLGWRTQLQAAHWKNTETLFRYTLKLSSNSVQALYGLGSYLVDHGQTQEGKQLLQQTIRLQPTYVEAIGTLASTLDGEGRYAEAVRYYEDGLKAQPNHPAVLNNFAWLRATCPDATLRDGAQAVQLATRACELTDYSKPIFIGTLAAAHAETGDFQAAIAAGQQAASLASALQLNDTAWRNRELIELYRQGKAAHGESPKRQ